MAGVGQRENAQGGSLGRMENGEWNCSRNVITRMEGNRKLVLLRRANGTNCRLTDTFVKMRGMNGDMNKLVKNTARMPSVICFC